MKRKEKSNLREIKTTDKSANRAIRQNLKYELKTFTVYDLHTEQWSGLHCEYSIAI